MASDDTSYGIGLTNEASEEERRLFAAERVLDPGTFRHLDGIGIAPGMRCLEVGGGTGSVTRWLSERVGPTGFVLVTDIDTRWLVECNEANIEVRTHDISTDPLDSHSFDLIHARQVLEHVPKRLEVIEKLANALRPGGWLVLEDNDFSDWLYLPVERLLSVPKELARATQSLMRGLIASTSWDAEFGRDLPLHLLNAGLRDVDSEASSKLLVGGSPISEFVTLAWRQVGHVAVDAGFLSAQELAALIDAFEQPGSVQTGAAMVTAWGRRPD